MCRVNLIFGIVLPCLSFMYDCGHSLGKISLNKFISGFFLIVEEVE